MTPDSIQVTECQTQSSFIEYVQEFASLSNKPGNAGRISLVFGGPGSKEEAKSWSADLSDATAAYVSAGPFSFTIVYVPQFKACVLTSGPGASEDLSSWVQNRRAAVDALKKLNQQPAQGR